MFFSTGLIHLHSYLNFAMSSGRTAVYFFHPLSLAHFNYFRVVGWFVAFLEFPFLLLFLLVLLKIDSSPKQYTLIAVSVPLLLPVLTTSPRPQIYSISISLQKTEDLQEITFNHNKTECSKTRQIHLLPGFLFNLKPN